MTRALGFMTLAGALLGAALSACSAKDRPGAIGDIDVDSAAPVARPAPTCEPEPTEAPLPGADGLCGNLFLDAAGKPPNLYFVIDRSGSMETVVDGRQKYGAVADAAVKLVRSLGARANVGAAVFPAGPSGDACAGGEEVFPPTPGDGIRLRACEGDGPVTRAFSRSISLPARVDPRGSTPTAATLTALTPRLSALPGTTAVILATDGGPNCNPLAQCAAEACIPNIEGECAAQLNCCADTAYGPRACLDAEPTRAAVAELWRRGIKTYVVGVPGSGPYRELLSALALAGGTARETAPAYYEVEHIAELDAMLGAIGAAATVSCDLTLSETPPLPGLVNVYLDRRLVSYGSADGWQWSSELDATSDGGALSADGEGARDRDGDRGEPDGAVGDEVSATSAEDHDAEAPPALEHRRFRLRGAACADFESGRARQLQVTFGCPTAVIN